MKQQLKYFIQDVKRMLGKQKFRILYIWFSRIFWGIFLYRIERSGFLLFGKLYKYIRIIFIPVINLLQAFTNIDINYNADIKGGLLVLHASVGVVISGRSVIGERLTLTGGNVIGAKPGCKYGGLIIGSHCTLGANSTILGPIKLANHISIGAQACVVKDCDTDYAVLTGVPAKQSGSTLEK